MLIDKFFFISVFNICIYYKTNLCYFCMYFYVFNILCIFVNTFCIYIYYYYLLFIFSMYVLLILFYSVKLLSYDGCQLDYDYLYLAAFQVCNQNIL